MPTTPVNKSALNALTDLYYLYGDLVQHGLVSPLSPEELDIFYLRSGLKDMLEQFYTQASLDPVEAGSNTESLTLERMLPIGTISQATQATWKQIQDARGDLKLYNDAKEAYGTPVPQEVQEVVRQGRELIASRTKRTRSGADVALVDIASAVIAYEQNTLLIDAVRIPLESHSLMDLITDYMVNQKTRGEQVDVAVIMAWLEEETMAPRDTNSQGVKDACRAVNEKVKDKLSITQDFYNTGVANKIIRNY